MGIKTEKLPVKVRLFRREDDIEKTSGFPEGTWQICLGDEKFSSQDDYDEVVNKAIMALKSATSGWIAGMSHSGVTSFEAMIADITSVRFVEAEGEIGLEFDDCELAEFAASTNHVADLVRDEVPFLGVSTANAAVFAKVLKPLTDSNVFKYIGSCVKDACPITSGVCSKIQEILGLSKEKRALEARIESLKKK